MSRPLIDASQSVGTDQVTLLEATARRHYLLIGNAHASQVLWVNMAGGTAAANGLGCIAIAAGANIRFENNVPNNKITGIASGASTPAAVMWA